MSYSLGIRGSIRDILFSRVVSGRLFEVGVKQSGFSFGLGGIAGSADAAIHRLGELWTCPGFAAVLPADGHFMPETSGPTAPAFFTPFNVVLRGVENKTLLELNGESGAPLTALEIWEKLLETHPDTAEKYPLYGAVWIAETVSLRGSFVRRPPVPENAPPDSKPINDPETHEDWFGVAPDGGGKGLVVIAVGAALNPLHPRLSDLNGMERRIFYLNPGSPQETTVLMLHQHALCLDPTPLPEPGTSAEEAAMELLREGTVRDVKHVLDDSLFTGVRAAFFPCSSIREIP